jgi:hypothetical protein
MQHKPLKRMRRASDARELDRVLSTASPAMRQEMLAMAHRINFV